MCYYAYMMHTSIQNAIKVGTSAGVTLPAKEFKRMGLKIGDPIKITFEPAVDTSRVELVELTQNLIKRHEKALKNLSQR